jgi:hypothetical protein
MTGMRGSMRLILRATNLPIHVRHAVIQNHKVNAVPPQESQTYRAAVGRKHAVASGLEDELAGTDARLVIVNTKDELLSARLRRHLGWKRHGM